MTFSIIEADDEYIGGDRYVLMDDGNIIEFDTVDEFVSAARENNALRDEVLGNLSLLAHTLIERYRPMYNKGLSLRNLFVQLKSEDWANLELEDTFRKFAELKIIYDILMGRCHRPMKEFFLHNKNGKVDTLYIRDALECIKVSTGIKDWADRNEVYASNSELKAMSLIEHAYNLEHINKKIGINFDIVYAHKIDTDSPLGEVQVIPGKVVGFPGIYGNWFVRNVLLGIGDKQVEIGQAAYNTFTHDKTFMSDSDQAGCIYYRPSYHGNCIIDLKYSDLKQLNFKVDKYVIKIKPEDIIRDKEGNTGFYDLFNRERKVSLIRNNNFVGFVCIEDALNAFSSNNEVLGDFKSGLLANIYLFKSRLMYVNNKEQLLKKIVSFNELLASGETVDSLNNRSYSILEDYVIQARIAIEAYQLYVILTDTKRGLEILRELPRDYIFSLNNSLWGNIEGTVIEGNSSAEAKFNQLDYSLHSAREIRISDIIMKDILDESEYIEYKRGLDEWTADNRMKRSDKLNKSYVIAAYNIYSKFKAMHDNYLAQVGYSKLLSLSDIRALDDLRTKEFGSLNSHLKVMVQK